MKAMAKEKNGAPVSSPSKLFHSLEQLTPVKRRSDAYSKSINLQQRREQKKDTNKNSHLKLSF